MCVYVRTFINISTYLSIYLSIYICMYVCTRQQPGNNKGAGHLACCFSTISPSIVHREP